MEDYVFQMNNKQFSLRNMKVDAFLSESEKHKVVFMEMD